MVRGVLLSQLVQETRANLCIRVVPDREWSPLERDRLLLYATRMVGPGMKVRIEVAEKEEVLDPSGKIRPVSALGSDTERCYP